MTKPIRIQRKREKGWRMPENTVYVGRPSKWGNPFQFEHEADYTVRKGAVLNYLEWLNVKLKEKQFREDIKLLANKNLACFCQLDQPCHADVLLEIAND